MIEPGKPFPAFSLPNQDGVTTSLAGTSYWDRVTFVVDPKGVVRKVYPKVKPDGHDQEVLRDPKALQKA